MIVESLPSSAGSDQALRRAGPRIRFRGVDRVSPLGALLESAVSANATVVGGEATAVAAKSWARVVSGRNLQWWVTERGPGGGIPCAADGDVEDVDILVDLFGTEPPAAFTGRYWRAVDGSGEAILNPFCFLETCCRAPFVASVYLVESAPRGSGWRVLAQAHISNRDWYRQLLVRVGAVAAQLVASALLRDGTVGVSAAPIVPVTRARSKSGVFLGRVGALVTRLYMIIRETAFNDYWAIGICDALPEALVRSQVLRAERWVESPSPGSYLADPFPWPGRADIVLCERYEYRHALGSLRALTLRDSRVTGDQPLDLGLPALHLSYPCTFREGGRVFLLPEMAASRSLALFELLSTGEVRKLCVIENGAQIDDPTLFKHDGYYWIAYGDRRFAPHESLCLLYARELDGPWISHPLNPVKIDIRSSRPGGTPFVVDGKLYRPAQDCSATYGGALVVNLVRVCTPSSYEEEPIAVLRADPHGPFPDGVHTLSIDGRRVVFDGKRFWFDPRRLLKRMSAYVGRHSA